MEFRAAWLGAPMILALNHLYLQNAQDEAAICSDIGCGL
jgi:hypothetical protein